MSDSNAIYVPSAVLARAGRDAPVRTRGDALSRLLACVGAAWGTRGYTAGTITGRDTLRAGGGCTRAELERPHAIPATGTHAGGPGTDPPKATPTPRYTCTLHGSLCSPTRLSSASGSSEIGFTGSLSVGVS